MKHAQCSFPGLSAAARGCGDVKPKNMLKSFLFHRKMNISNLDLQFRALSSITALPPFEMHSGISDSVQSSQVQTHLDVLSIEGAEPEH